MLVRVSRIVCLFSLGCRELTHGLTMSFDMYCFELLMVHNLCEGRSRPPRMWMGLITRLGRMLRLLTSRRLGLEQSAMTSPVRVRVRFLILDIEHSCLTCRCSQQSSSAHKFIPTTVSSHHYCSNLFRR